MNNTEKQENFIRKKIKRYFPFSIEGDFFHKVVYYLRILKGFSEAILGIQHKELREYWKDLPKKRLKEFLHVGGAGKEHPSRIFVASLVKKGESVLDVGCGAGVNYEVLDSLGLACDYIGIDSSEPSIESAKELYPKGDFRICNAYDMADFFKSKKFDVVIVRAVLEHLPDFEEVMAQAIDISKRLAIFIFFLSPRYLPFGIKKLNVYIDPPFYTNVYSKQSIEYFLAMQDVKYSWYHDIGESRTSWLSNEKNSILVISRNNGSSDEGKV